MLVILRHTRAQARRRPHLVDPELSTGYFSFLSGDAPKSAKELYH